MIRRVLAVPAVLLAAAWLGGCSMFSDNAAAARVDDDELSDDELDELLVAVTPGAEDGETIEVSGETARGVISSWVLTSILEQDITAAGATVADTDTDDARGQLETQAGWAENTPEVLRDFDVRRLAAINVWSALETDPPDESELRDAYDTGIEASGIACTAHILVETEAEALEILDELEAGGDFAELAARHSIDGGSADSGGVIPCTTSDMFAQNYAAEYVEAARAAELGVPTEPVLSQFGYHIILVRPFDDVVDEGIADLYNEIPVRFRRTAREADIYVDPRYGTFDPSVGVVPLG